MSCISIAGCLCLLAVAMASTGTSYFRPSTSRSHVVSLQAMNDSQMVIGAYSFRNDHSVNYIHLSVKPVESTVNVKRSSTYAIVTLFHDPICQRYLDKPPRWVSNVSEIPQNAVIGVAGRTLALFDEALGIHLYKRSIQWEDRDFCFTIQPSSTFFDAAGQTKMPVNVDLQYFVSSAISPVRNTEAPVHPSKKHITAENISVASIGASDIEPVLKSTPDYRGLSLGLALGGFALVMVLSYATYRRRLNQADTVKYSPMRQQRDEETQRYLVNPDSM